MKIKILIIFVIFLFFSNIANGAINSQSNINLDMDDSKLIDEFTWSILKYDHVIESRNYGAVDIPKPTAGPLVILSNMMSKKVCHNALSLYHENRMDLLKALEKFDIENMKIFLLDYYKAMLTIRFSRYYSSSKTTADEMILLGDRLIKDYYSGFCYSQACFNTAVLRLCGVPAEDVFNLLIPSHVFTVVKINNTWYAFDSAKGQYNEDKKYIYERYETNSKYFSTLENDKYFINFETYEDEEVPSMYTNYSNMDPNLLIDVITGIQTLMNNSKLGSVNCSINDFVNNSIPYPDWKNVSVPYTIHNACGDTNKEKANHLANLIEKFVENQSGNNTPNQYDRCLYSLGVFPGKYPQAYANAAKYGARTGNYAKLLDSRNPKRDIRRTASWVNLIIKTREISKDNHVYNSEFIYRIKKGSTIDKALISYGTLRNMIKENDFWQPENLFVIITEDNKGYLAVNTGQEWTYLNFDRGKNLKTNPPKNIILAFNEIEYFNSWKN